MSDLADRIEQEGPSRELDEAITRMLYNECGAALPADIKIDAVREYTASIDAAMTLVPEGFAWGVEVAPWAEVGDTRMYQAMIAGHIGVSPSPAAALCAAALKARNPT